MKVVAVLLFQFKTKADGIKWMIKSSQSKSISHSSHMRKVDR